MMKNGWPITFPTVQPISSTTQEVVRTLCQVAPDAGRPPPEVQAGSEAVNDVGQGASGGGGLCCILAWFDMKNCSPEN